MDFEAIAIVALLFVAFPAVVMHYMTRWKAMKGISAEDEASFGDLNRQAGKLEDRLRTLERILDDEVPDWRSRYYDQ